MAFKRIAEMWRMGLQSAPRALPQRRPRDRQQAPQPAEPGAPSAAPDGGYGAGGAWTQVLEGAPRPASLPMVWVLSIR